MKSNGRAPSDETGVSAYRPQYEQAVKIHVETVLSAYRQEARRRLLTDDTAEARREP